MPIEVGIDEIKPQKAVTISIKAPYSEIGKSMEEGFGKLMSYLTNQSVEPQAYAGPAFAQYFSVEDPGAWDYALGIPVSQDVPESDEIKMGELPGGKVATTTLVGPYERLKETWDAFGEWMNQSEHEPVGAPWESYVKMPPVEPDAEKWQTDIVWPIS